MEAMSASANGQPDGVIVVRKLTAPGWTQLRAARLSALAEAPYAFASTLAREQEFTDEVWRSRAGRGLTFGAWQGATVVGLATGLPTRATDAAEAAAPWHLVGMWVAPHSAAMAWPISSWRQSAISPVNPARHR
jgi:hypothetical protein